jgi:metal-dependent amidase/aminoacylase/carboxypeptidase family protein
VLRGTVRTFEPKVQDMAEANIGRIAKNVAAAHGAEASTRYDRRYPATVNSPPRPPCGDASPRVDEAGSVVEDIAPSMGAEDFAFMLQKTPGNYIWLGVGETHPNLHSPHFDFNDEIFPIGASYWARLVEETLKAEDPAR